MARNVVGLDIGTTAGRAAELSGSDEVRAPRSIAGKRAIASTIA